MKNIVFMTDNNCVMPTYIAILSLYNSKLKSTQLKVYITTYNVTKENCELLKTLSRDDFEVILVDISHLELDDLSNENIKRYAPIILFRLQLDSIFPNLSKILLLDVDIIVKKDISTLFEVDLNGKYIAGVRDLYVTFEYMKNKNILYEHYVNSGVLLLNLDLIRKDNFFKKVSEYYLNNGKNFKYPEQDAINYLIGEKIKLLPPIYNYLVSYKRFSKKYIANFYKLYSETLLDENNIAIIHYAGYKPWVYKTFPLEEHWDKIYQISGFANQPLDKINKYNILVNLYINIRSIWHKVLYWKIFKKLISESTYTD